MDVTLNTMLKHVNSYRHRRLSFPTVPPDASPPPNSSWVSVGDEIDEIYKGKVGDYFEQKLSPSQESLLKFHSHSYYRDMRLQCDRVTLFHYLRKPLLFTRKDVVHDLAKSLCTLVLQSFKVCKPPADVQSVLRRSWYEDTFVVFESSAKIAPTLSAFMGAGGRSRFQIARQNCAGIGEDAFPQTTVFTMTLGQKFLFLLALFVPHGNPAGFHELLAEHGGSPVDKVFSPYLHWFVLLLHHEDYKRKKCVPLTISDWALPARFSRFQRPLDILSSFWPFFDICELYGKEAQGLVRSQTGVNVSLTLDHVFLLFLLIPLRLAQADGIHHASDSTTLMRSGLRILVRSFTTGKQIYEADQVQKDGLEPWFLDFDLYRSPFLERWLKTMDVLSKWFSQAKWRVKDGKCSWKDLKAYLSAVAPEPFVGVLEEILKWLPSVTFVSPAIQPSDVVLEGIEGILGNAIKQTNNEIASETWTLTRVRSETIPGVENLLMGKRVPYVGGQRGFAADVERFGAGRSAFVMENTVAVWFHKSQKAFREGMFNALLRLKSATVDEKGVKEIDGETVSESEFSSLYDFFDKHSETHSSLVHMHKREFFLLYAFNWCNYYAHCPSQTTRVWSTQEKLTQTLFFLSLLRADELRREVIPMKQDPKDPMKQIRRLDSYMPLIYKRYEAQDEIATSFDYLYGMLATCLEWDHKTAVSKEVLRDRRAVVHIARLLYILRGKNYHQFTFESQFCVRNSVLTRADAHCTQAVCWAVFAMGLPRTGYAFGREVGFFLPMRTAVLNFYNSTAQGPRLLWTDWQKTQIDKAQKNGILGVSHVNRPRLLFYADDDSWDTIVKNDYMELTKEQVHQLCNWFEHKDPADGKWKGVVMDETRAAIFWAVYSNVCVRLPCTVGDFRRFCSLGSLGGLMPRTVQVNTEYVGESIWPTAVQAFPPMVLHRELKEPPSPGFPTEISPAYLAFFGGLNGCAGVEFPCYAQENDLWTCVSFVHSALTNPLSPPVGAGETLFAQFPLKHKSHEVIHPLFESMKFQEKIQDSDLLVQFVTETCKSRATLLPPLFTPVQSPVQTLLTPRPPPPPLPRTHTIEREPQQVFKKPTNSWQ